MRNYDAERVMIANSCYEVVCVKCGEVFMAKRNDAAFCSAKCRMAHKRQLQRGEKAVEELKKISMRINEIAREFKYSKSVFDEMVALELSVQYAIGTFEKRDEFGVTTGI